MTTYYKVLDEKARAYHGGRGSWPLPETGKWKSVRGALVPCKNGLHVCTCEQLIRWLGPAIFVCEVDGEIVDAGNKTVVRRARLVSRVDMWNERTARLFAADCAEHALRLVTKSTGEKTDTRSRAAVRATREFANGNISKTELAAAWAAAWDAARAASRAAARDAAWDAARDAEHKWQTKRLFEYLDGKWGVL